MSKGRSTIADVINYDPNPSWEKMINEIIQIKQKMPHALTYAIRYKLDVNFYYHCNVGEEHGLQSKEQIGRFLEEIDKDHLSVEEQETLNLRDAHFCLLSKGEDGLLEESMLREVNEIILRKLPRHNRYTKAGKYCNNPRVTQFQGKIYYYQQPEDMQEAVCTLLDRYNSLITQSINETDETDRLLSIFKSIAWLVFELLDLHPFSDGNGRLCRLLCSYVLSTYTPFPSPIYNSSNYMHALIAARKSKYPYELTNIIIESNVTSWRMLADINV